MGELPVETAVSSPSDSGGVVQLEGTVGRQLRKSSQTSSGKSAPEIVAIGAEESLLDMGDELLVSSVSSTPLFMCDTASGFFLLNSTKASSTWMSSQSTH
jgi:hypothetical protein